MKIAIDIDSTLHHYWDVLQAAARRRFGVSLPYEEQVTWEIAQLRPEQLKACITETHSERAVLDAEPYPGAVEVVSRWKEQGHWIHITSHRDRSAHHATERWLERIGLPYDDLLCSWDKISAAKELGIDLLIDDSPVNLRKALDAGMRAATINHPWNRDVVEEEDVVGADDWTELERKLADFLR